MSSLLIISPLLPALSVGRLTPSLESQLPGEMITLASPIQPVNSEQAQDALQGGWAHHVKMGNRFSCPRTPLRSAGSSPGLTPTIRPQRRSRTESESSIQSRRIPNYFESDLGRSTDELASVISLSFPRSLASGQNGQSELLSSPTPLISLGFASSDAGSIYSHNSDADNETTAVARLSPSRHTRLSPSRHISASSTCAPSSSSIYSGGDGAYDSLVKSKLASPMSTSASPLSASASPLSTSASPLSTSTSPLPTSTSPKLMPPSPSIRSNIRSRASSASLTPSLLTEPTKTIQARRSFGQLLLFRRPSQIREGVCLCAKSCHLHQPDEETEELQTCVHNDVSLASSNLFGDPGETYPPGSGMNSVDCINARNQREDHGSHQSNLDLHAPETTAMRRLGSAQSIPPESADTICTKHPEKDYPPRRGSSTILDRPRGFLKLVKRYAQSSLRDTFFHTKKTQRSQSVQFDQLASNVPNLSVEACSPNLVGRLARQDTRRSSEVGRDSFATRRSENPVTSRPKIEDTPVVHQIKRGSFSQATSFNVFKFWKKKKNDDSLKPNPDKPELLKKNSLQQNSKKSGSTKTKQRPAVKIDQISPPIMMSEEVSIRSLRRNTRPLRLSPRQEDNASNFSSRQLSSESDISFSPSTPASGRRSSPTIACRTEPFMETTFEIQLNPRAHQGRDQ
ncbi:hypothetical protein VP01_3276g1 [Puccinia sorghi]|uniref:Uncharacterized protein n=1 Tax=Puccinia sorghi TaxID=27349 RepID=A0A0L6UYL5_9BASI|nr:hypothetical protein VP01_3276g1 [Puccinia sorghi]